MTVRLVSVHLLLYCWTALTIADLGGGVEGGGDGGGGGGGGGENCSSFSKLDLGDAIRGTDVKVRFLLYPAGPGSTCGRLVNTSAAGTLLLTSSPSSSPGVGSTVVPLQNRSLTFIIHGFRISGSKPVWLDSMVATLHTVRPQGDVIVVDWNHGATHVVYKSAVANTHLVAQELAHLIRRLLRDGEVLPERIHVIGASLGAHIAGMAGAELNGVLGRISALDAAGPEFEERDASGRLDHSDANFVDVYHSDTDTFGMQGAVGHVDYFLNGGEDQPGCPKTILQGKEFVICDHQRSSFLFLSSMVAPCRTRAFPCASRDLLRRGRCSNCADGGIGSCPLLGYWAEEWLPQKINFSRVVAFAETSKKSPFCAVYYEVRVSVGGEERWGGVSGQLALRLVGRTGLTALTHLDSSPMLFSRGSLVIRVVSTDPLPGAQPPPGSSPSPEVISLLAWFSRSGARHRYRRGETLPIRELRVQPLPITRGEAYCSEAVTLREDTLMTVPVRRC